MLNFNSDEYIDEVKEKWGNTESYKEQIVKTKDYSKEKFEALGLEMNNIFAEFASCMNDGNDVNEEVVQSLVKKLQNHITENYYNCTKDILAGLGQMYVMDERFKNNIDKNGEGTAEYVSKAIALYCKK